MKFVGVIPSAGKGTRLAPLPFSKELFPLGYQKVNVGDETQWRPKVVSQYLVEQMIYAGINQIFIILGPGKHSIMEYYGGGNKWNINISYLYQEEPRGLPFALDLLRPWVSDDDLVVFGMPDTIITPSAVFAELVADHQRQGADLTLAVFRTDTPQKFGMVDINESGEVIHNVDKPEHTDLEYMWGACCWSSKLTQILQTFTQNVLSEKEAVLSNVFEYAIRQKLKVRAFKYPDSEYCDIGTVDELNKAIRKFSRIDGE